MAPEQTQIKSAATAATPADATLWVRVESRSEPGQFYFYNPVTKVTTWEPPPQPARQIVPPTKQYDARKLYRNGTIIEVPGHSALRICDKVTGAKNNFCIPKATDLKEKFDKKHAAEAVTIKISEACELTFTKKNTNAGSNVNNVKGAYFCTVEDVELWIHDSTRPTEFTPVFLAFDQQKKNDNSKYNTRLALDEDYNKIGLPQKKVINLQRCQTDWLSMVKLSSEFDGCLPGEKCLGDSIYDTVLNFYENILIDPSLCPTSASTTSPY
jgi:hypothetical protein